MDSHVTLYKQEKVETWKLKKILYCFEFWRERKSWSSCLEGDSFSPEFQHWVWSQWSTGCDLFAVWTLGIITRPVSQDFSRLYHIVHHPVYTSSIAELLQMWLILPSSLATIQDFFFFFSSASIFRVLKIKRRRGKESLVFMKFKAKTALPGQSPNHPTPTKVEYHTLHSKSWWSTTVLDSINGVALCHCWSIILSMENK